MNLHGIVSSAISAVNPIMPITLKKSTGYVMSADRKQVPTYALFPNILAQIQALSFSDLQRVGGLNVQGIRRKVYLNGEIEGVDRNAIKGGDLLIFPDMPNFPGPTTWLVVQSLEQWPDWCPIAVTLQDGS